MESLSFDDLFKSILKLFKVGSSSCYDYEYLNLSPPNGTMVWIESYHGHITDILGNISEFHDWLKPKLEDFFDGLHYCFQTACPRDNKRRFLAYGNIISNKKLRKRKSFMGTMAKEFSSDLCSIRDKGYPGFYGSDADTEEKRRIIFFTYIKNYVYRLFTINFHCTPKF